MGTLRPLVIAHRGASGYLPEHTLVAKALAYGQGADFLEQDVVAARDGELIVCHDTWLEAVTDVADLYPGRARSDGHFYAVDFDLAELKTLSVRERERRPGEPRFPTRFARDAGAFPVVTLADELRFVAGLNASSGGTVGVYPEIKAPAWHRQHGIELGDRLLAALDESPFASTPDRVYVQCFDADELQRLAGAARWRYGLVQLVEAGSPLASSAAMRAVAGYARVVGLDLKLALGPGGGELLRAARDAGLRVHVWTLRWDALPACAESAQAVLEQLRTAGGADGIFTDFPDRLAKLLAAGSRQVPQQGRAGPLSS